MSNAYPWDKINELNNTICGLRTELLKEIKMHNKPTCQELYNEEDNIAIVAEELIETWKWGTLNRTIYKIDDTYWAATYRTSSDGETNELRDGDAEIVEVEQKEVVKKVWVEKSA